MNVSILSLLGSLSTARLPMVNQRLCSCIPALLFATLLLFLSSAHAYRENYTCHFAPSIPEDRRPSPYRLRIVQFNVEFFFLDQSEGGLVCPGPDCPWPDAETAHAHALRIANVLKELRPDIVNLCEVEGCDEMNWLATRLNEEASERVQEEAGQDTPTQAFGYNYFLLKGQDTFTGQNTALLTRIDPSTDLDRSTDRVSYPLPGSQCGWETRRASAWAGGNFRQQFGDRTNGHIGGSADGQAGVSKHYFTTFHLQEVGVKIAIVGIHLLARPIDPERCAEREAQATVLRGVVDGFIAEGYEVVVLGDFNDFDGSVPDINNNLPTSRVMEILKGTDLFPTATFLPQAERYTDWWDRNGNCQVDAPEELDMIDHVLLTKGLQERVIAVYVYHTYDEYCGTLDSDHYPVVIDLEWEGVKKEWLDDLETEGSSEMA